MFSSNKCNVEIALSNDVQGAAIVVVIMIEIKMKIKIDRNGQE